jgi:PKD repeat protein
VRSKSMVFLLVGFFIIFSLSSYAETEETKKLKRVGVFTLVRIKGEIPVPEVMKTILDKYSEDIKYGLDLAGYGELYLPFIEQIETASFEEKQLPIGDILMWMLFRVRGQIKVVENIEWAGKAPLPVFSFTVVKGYNHYEFVMPKPCGNIALRKIEEIIPDAVCDIMISPAKANLNDPISVDMSGSQEAKSMKLEVFDADGNKITSQSLSSDSPKWQTSFDKPGEYVFKGTAFNVKDKPSENRCEARTYINSPPVGGLTSSTVEDYVGLPVTFDASGASDPDGDIAKIDFEITDEDGNLVDRFTDTERPFTWEKTFEDEGAYTVTSIATDDFGATSEPARVELSQKHKRLFFLIDASPLVAFGGGDTGGYVAGRAGVLYKLTPGKLDLIVEGGGAIKFGGAPWKSFGMASVLLNYYAGEAFYIGGGAGFSSSTRDGQGSAAEIVVDAGYDVIDKFTMKGSIFVEGRFLADTKLMAGFRLIL